MAEPNLSYHITGCAEVALGYLNMGDITAAQHILLSALSLFQDAELEINRFQKEATRGNAAA